ncbi:MAG TPA: TerC/Alx family metal homeostasis membrane protein [Pseudonocardiaceae bacterium]|nr:TerC/Alx family metal homeostasis membrane protein [Pseudonocardiaceae bacterium]
MNVPLWLWLATIVGLLAVFGIDLLLVNRDPHKITMREAATSVGGYVVVAIVFGILVWLFAGGRYAGEYFSGYITEYSLSVDNLFVFLVIMTAFAVPVVHQHRVLLIGILIALVLRGTLIMLGAALINQFIAIFYLFGAFLIFTAVRLVRTPGPIGEHQYVENAALRLLRRAVPVTREYHGSRAFVRVDGRRMVTPMLVVIIAIGTTDLIFALDSIPAVFGLTRQSYLVFVVNAFALLGLRQLYFLLGDLLRRMVYLRFGLSVLLLFIGVKLILEAMAEDWQPFVPGQQAVPVPVPGPFVSLLVVLGILAATILASLARMRHKT